MRKLAVFVALVLCSAGLAMAGGTLSVISESNSTSVFDLTPNGAWAAGVDMGQAFRWSEAGGIEYLSPSEWQWTSSIGISADGTQVASTVDYGGRVFGPARWTEGSGWEYLDTLYEDPPYQGGSDWSFGDGYDISGDGSTVCGLAWHPGYDASGFSWTAGGGIVDLGHPVGASSRASAISIDGSTIVGFWEHETYGMRRPVRWVNNGPADLFLGTETWGEAMGTSSDGSVLVGQVGFIDDPGYGYALAFTYSDAAGYRNLGILPWQSPYDNQSMATGVSDNGIVVGWSGSTGPWGFLEPFVWTEAGGMVLAGDYLAAQGVVVPANIAILSVTTISADGTTLGGQGLNLDTYQYAAWVAKIVPEPRTLQVTVTGTVEYNQVHSGALAGVSAGDPVTLSFRVRSDEFTDSMTYPTRGYAIDPASYALTLGSVTVGLQDPYPGGQTPFFVLRNNDPAVDGFFIANNNVDVPWPGLPLSETGAFGPFESHMQVGYTGETLSSLDILDAVGVYDYTGLTNFYFTVNDGGFEPIGLLFGQLEIEIAATFDASLSCLTPTLHLPERAAFRIDLANLTDGPIQVAGHVDATLCNGQVVSHVRSGSVMLGAAESRNLGWNMPIPAYNSTCGCDLLFTLIAQDTATAVEKTSDCTVTTTCD